MYGKKGKTMKETAKYAALILALLGAISPHAQTVNPTFLCKQITDVQPQPDDVLCGASKYAVVTCGNWTSVRGGPWKRTGREIGWYAAGFSFVIFPTQKSCEEYARNPMDLYSEVASSAALLDAFEISDKNGLVAICKTHDFDTDKFSGCRLFEGRTLDDLMAIILRGEPRTQTTLTNTPLSIGGPGDTVTSKANADEAQKFKPALSPAKCWQGEYRSIDGRCLHDQSGEHHPAGDGCNSATCMDPSCRYSITTTMACIHGDDPAILSVPTMTGVVNDFSNLSLVATTLNVGTAHERIEMPFQGDKILIAYDNSDVIVLTVYRDGHVVTPDKVKLDEISRYYWQEFARYYWQEIGVQSCNKESKP